MRLYPLMVAVVLFVYLLVAIVAIFRKVGGGPIGPENYLYIISVLIVGMGLILALMYLMASRSYKHVKRDINLMKDLTVYLKDYSRARSIDCTKEIRIMEDNIPHAMGQSVLYGLFVIAMLPALVGAAVTFLNPMTDESFIQVLILFMVSVIFCAVVLVVNINLPKKHEKTFLKFSDAFVDGMHRCGVGLYRYEPAIGVRSFIILGILTIVTLGLFFPLWIYISMRDMNRHLDEQWTFENSIAESIL